MSEPEQVHVVDDDASTRRSLARLLGGAGYRVALYATAEELLAAAGPALAGCILLDLRLPGASGLEAQERLAERGCTTPVVFLTGHGDVAASVRAMKRGALDFLQKPVAADELFAAVAAALRRDAAARRQDAGLAVLRAAAASLSDRQREVWLRVVRGAAEQADRPRPGRQRAHGEAAPRACHAEAGRTVHGRPRADRGTPRTLRGLGLRGFTKGNLPRPATIDHAARPKCRLSLRSTPARRGRPTSCCIGSASRGRSPGSPSATGISSRTLNRVTRREAGLSPMALLRRARLAQARLDLECRTGHHGDEGRPGLRLHAPRALLAGLREAVRRAAVCDAAAGPPQAVGRVG